jgi:hypothetical protein
MRLERAAVGLHSSKANPKPASGQKVVERHAEGILGHDTRVYWAFLAAVLRCVRFAFSMKPAGAALRPARRR